MSRRPKERYALLMGGFHKSPKIRALSLEARGLLAMCWSYSASEMSDGRVPREYVEAWAGKRAKALLKELTAGEAGVEGKNPLLRIDGIDVVCHGWLDVNISRAKYLGDLERDRIRHAHSGGNPPGARPDIQPDPPDEDEEEGRSDPEQQRSPETLPGVPPEAGSPGAAPPPTYRDLAGHRAPQPSRAPKPAESASWSPAHLALIRGYRERCDAANRVWTTIPHQHIATCAVAIEAQARASGLDVERVAGAWLTAAFADREMLARVKADVPPWGVLAKRPEQWLSGEAAQTREQRRKAELAEIVNAGGLLTDEQRAELRALTGKPGRDALGAALGGRRVST